MTPPTTSITLSSGTIAHNWPNPNRTSSPTKATFLFQHGFGDYSQRWATDYPFIFTSLHTRNIEIWAMDLRGHGTSPGQRSIVHISKAISDHNELCNILTKPTNSPPLFLLGHSLGGLITAGSVISNNKNTNQNPKGVILAAPALATPTLIPLRHLITTISKLIPKTRIPLPKSSLDGLTNNQESIRKWTSDPNVFHGQISFLLAATSLNVAYDLFQRVENEWIVPTLVVHGDRDTYTDYRQSERFVESMGEGVDKRFWGLEGGRHDVFSDGDCEGLWEGVLSWLDERID